MNHSSSRRNFLRYSTLAGLGLTLNPLSSIAHSEEEKKDEGKSVAGNLTPGQQVVTILQTTDVHCQLHSHDEMFWENNQMRFRSAGGYAQLATIFKEIRTKNPNSFVIDTGDMFQGSQLSVETTGKAMQPILNAMGYNLYLPGNWEVVYGKKEMQKIIRWS